MFYEKINYRLTTKNRNMPTIVFLHGWGCSMKSFEYFERFFSYEYNTLNLDLYGFGLTEELKNADIYDYTKKIYLFLKSKNISNIIIVCHSFGFRIATILSTCFDINISNIIATGGAGCKPKFSIIRWFKIYYYKLFVKNKKIKNTNKNIYNKQNRFKRDNENSKRLSYCSTVNNKNITSKKLVNKINKYGSDDYRTSSGEMKKFLIKVVNQHLDYLYKDFKCSLLLYWGRKDKATPLYIAKRICDIVQSKECELIVVDGDHFCFLQDREYFARAIRKYLFSHFILN